MNEQLVCHCCESVDVAEQYELCGQCYQDWIESFSSVANNCQAKILSIRVDKDRSPRVASGH